MGSDGAGFQEHAAGNTYWSLAWSPAGNQLLLQRVLDGPDSFRPPDFSKPSAIFLPAPDGTELSQVTSAGTSTPDWATTGEIAFTRARNDPSCFACSDLHVMRLGGTPRRLTYRSGSSPSWSPHGTKLTFVRADHSRVTVVRTDVYVVGRDGHGLRRLTRRGGYAPAWSPDGKWIAFGRANDLYVVRAAGGGLRRLVNAPTRDALDPRGGFVTALDWQPLPRVR
jgi:dipeptidyl aminopeptidase/acylaminoacyl peptidase